MKFLSNKWTILSLIALVVILSSALYYYSSMQTGEQEQTVETSTISTGDIILTATGLGSLVPQDEVSLSFKNEETVNEVLVELGEQVQAGQVLARLDSGTLELEYQQAEANLAALSTPGEIAKANQGLMDAREAFANARDDLEYMIGPDMMIAEEKVASAQQDLKSAQAALQLEPSDANKQKVSEAEANLKTAQEGLTYAYYNYSNTYTLDTFTYPIRNDKGTTIRRDLIAPTDTR